MKTEKEYRLERLSSKRKMFTDKKIILYGTGINAKYILDKLPELNVIALMDVNYEGEYIYGRKVVSEDEVLLIEPDFIIIAAETASAYHIFKRIGIFCKNYNIKLLNMYGEEEIVFHSRIMQQELRYSYLTLKNFKKQVELYDVICVELQGILCESCYFDHFSYLDVLQKKGEIKLSFIPKKFLEYHSLSEEIMPANGVYKIEQLYDVYQSLSGITEEESKELTQFEEEEIVNSLIPKNRMIEVIKELSLQGKKIYILSDLKVDIKETLKYLDKFALKDCAVLFQENAVCLSFVNGIVRRIYDENPDKKILYLGVNRAERLITPQLYGLDVYLLKTSWEISEQISVQHIKRERYIDNEKRNNITELIIKNFNSPFLEDNKELPLSSAKLLGRQKAISYKPILFGEIEDKNISDIEELVFPVWENPIVTIIIPAYNQFGYTYNCMQAILNNTINVSYEIILVDDCSTDDTKTIEKVIKNTKVIHNDKNLLFLLNCNQAARFARGKYILFLNNDTQVQYNWLEPMVRLFENNADVGLVGSKLVYPDGKLQDAGGIIYKDGTARNYGRKDDPEFYEYNYVREVDYVTGASMMISRLLWETIGGFDERYIPAYNEDSDLAFEVRKQGKKVLYQPASVVVHFEGISNGCDVQTGVKSYQIVNKRKFLDKWRSTLLQENHSRDSVDIELRDRKKNRKTILFISNYLPKPDRDAGSKTVYGYLKLFIKKGFIVKFATEELVNYEGYVMQLQQLGIETITGKDCQDDLERWLLENQNYVDYVFLHYPDCAFKYLTVLKCTSIKLRYYGHDLHYLRNRREYELTGNKEKYNISEQYYDKERKIIESVEKIFYPSDIEVQIVKDEFKKSDVKKMSPYMYDCSCKKNNYDPYSCSGIVFLGGFSHTPNVDAVLWFIKEIYPLILEKEEIPFYIAGSNPPQEIQMIDHLGVIVKGYLSEDELNDLYSKVKMVVVPLRYGAGVKGKVVEALYQGVPMVSTSIGIEGIPEAEQYIDIADSPELFAQKVLRSYNDNQRLLKISEGYRHIIEKYFSDETAWENIKDDFI